MALWADLAHSEPDWLLQTTSLVLSLHFFCWLLLTHLSYYILAHQIQVLRTYLSGNETRQPPRLSLAGAALHQMFKHFLIPQLLFFDLIFFECRQNQNMATKLQTIQNVFNLLCCCSDELNAFNSANFFLIFITKILNLILSVYMFIHSLFTRRDYSEFEFQSCVLLVVLDMVALWLIINAADSPVEEVIQSIFKTSFD